MRKVNGGNMFRNDDPAHARVNPLRGRRDRPHVWYQDGWYRVSPWNRRMPDLPAWERAQRYVGGLNYALHWGMRL